MVVIDSYPALAKPPLVLLSICTLGRHFFFGFSSASYLPQEDGENMERSQGRPSDTQFAFLPRYYTKHKKSITEFHAQSVICMTLSTLDRRHLVSNKPVMIKMPSLWWISVVNKIWLFEMLEKHRMVSTPRVLDQLEVKRYLRRWGNTWGKAGRN